jgi:hypothetical protein
MDDKSLEASGTMCFHGVEYAVSIWVQQDELHVQVEEESFKATSEINRWGAQFPALCAYHSTLIRHTIAVLIHTIHPHMFVGAIS